MQNNCLENVWEVLYEKQEQEEEWEKSVWRISPMKVVINTDNNICHEFEEQSFSMSFTPLNIYNGAPEERPTKDSNATLPINELKSNPRTADCPISNLHWCKQSEMDKLKAFQQKLVEESDNDLTKELFNEEGPKMAQTLLKRPLNPVGLSLNAKDQHRLLAEECVKKLKTGTSLHLYEFYKTLLLNLSEVLSNEHAKLLVKQLESTMLRDVSFLKKSTFKNDIEMRNKRYQEVFGEAGEEEYEFYTAKYEDF